MTADWSRNSFSSPFSRAFHNAASPAVIALPSPFAGIGFVVDFFGSDFSGDETAETRVGVPIGLLGVLFETDFTGFLKSRSSLLLSFAAERLSPGPLEPRRGGDFGSSWGLTDEAQHGQSQLAQAMVPLKLQSLFCITEFPSLSYVSFQVPPTTGPEQCKNIL
jgi:hypothetical protein